MIQNRLIKAFILSAPMVLGSGCAVYQNVDHDNCSESKELFLGVPEMLEIFNGKTSAEMNTACLTGRKIGYTPLFGRQKDGTLNSASLILWQSEYQDLIDKRSVLQPDDPIAKNLLAIQTFADYFLTEESRKGGKDLLTSPQLLTMFAHKTLDPQNVTINGKYAPKAPVQKQPECFGEGVMRFCKPANPTPQ